MQEQILAELEESYTAARGADDSYRNGLKKIRLAFILEDHENGDLLVANPNHPPPPDTDSEPGSESESTSNET